jgi:hypothetical protein
MSDDFKTDLKLSKSLKHAFQQYDWSIEQTAWLIIGFSTLIDPMILRSVVDCIPSEHMGPIRLKS